MSFSDIPGYGAPVWQGTAASFATLPTGQTVGEVRLALNTGILYRWTGAIWTGIGGGGGGAVDSVNGYTGAVVLTVSDISGAATSGANTDITSLQLAASAGNTGGLRFADTDTRISQPSDGLMSHYANNVLAMQVHPSGINVRTIDYVWPNAQGAAGTALLNDGSGNLTWGISAANLAITDTYSIDDGSSNRNYIAATYTGTGDSASNLNELLITVTDNSGFDLNGYWLVNLQGVSEGVGGDKDYIGALTYQQAIGNGTDAQTVNNAYVISSNVNLDAASTINAFRGVSLGLTALAGSTVNQSVGFLDNSAIDALVGYSGFQTSAQIESMTGNFDAFSFNGHVTASTQNVNGFGFSPTLGAITGQVRAYGSGGTWTSIGGGSLFEDFASITTQNNNYFGLNVHPAITTSAGFQGATIYPTITTATNYSGYRHGPSIATATNYMSGYSDNTQVTVTCTDYDSIGVFANIAAMTGNFKGINLNPTAVGASGSSADGIWISMQNVTGFDADDIKAINATGNVAITGIFNSQNEFVLVDNGGNPQPVNTINTGFTGSGAITNVDRFGFGPIMSLTLAAGCTATSTGLGVGVASLGMVNLLDLGTGATLDYTTGSFVAMVLPSGDGHIDNIIGYRSVIGAFGGTTTVDNVFGFKADLPFGDPATSSWGFYDVAAQFNWMANSLKIGGTAGSTDRVTNSSIGMELENRALRLAVMDTTARNALTAVAGMVIFNSTTSALEYYDGASWV